MYDYTYGYLPRYFQNTYNINTNVHVAYETRQSQMIAISMKKSRFVAKLTVFNFPTIWNNSDIQLNLYTSHRSLNRSLKTMYFNNYASSVNSRNPPCEDWHTFV